MRSKYNFLKREFERQLKEKDTRISDLENVIHKCTVEINRQHEKGCQDYDEGCELCSLSAAISSILPNINVLVTRENTKQTNLVKRCVKCGGMEFYKIDLDLCCVKCGATIPFPRGK